MIIWNMYEQEEQERGVTRRHRSVKRRSAEVGVFRLMRRKGGLRHRRNPSRKITQRQIETKKFIGLTDDIFSNSFTKSEEMLPSTKQLAKT